MKIGKELLEKMNETKVQEKHSDSNVVADDSKIPRQENDNMESLTLNGKATFILYFPFIQQPKFF